MDDRLGSEHTWRTIWFSILRAMPSPHHRARTGGANLRR
jgi:hypothetical protein